MRGLVVLTFFLGLTSCSPEHEGRNSEAPIATKEINVLEPFFLRPETIDYQTVNKFIFEPYCNNCHSEGGKDYDFSAVVKGLDMTSYEALIFDKLKPLKSFGVVPGRLEMSSLYTSIAEYKTMPPNKAKLKELVDQKLVKLLELWILNCAVEKAEDLSAVEKVCY